MVDYNSVKGLYPPSVVVGLVLPWVLCAHALRMGSMLILVLAALMAAETVAQCDTVTLDFILLEGDATAAALEDDISSDLAKVGITVNARYVVARLFAAPAAARSIHAAAPHHRLVRH